MKPIQQEIQIITQGFKFSYHNGVDLRCVDDKYKNLPVVTTERSQVLRQGIDGFGNYFLVLRPLDNLEFSELKFIHIEKTQFEIGQVLEENEFLSRCRIGGNSVSLHLHFEVWANGAPIDPVKYFDVAGIAYETA